MCKHSSESPKPPSPSVRGTSVGLWRQNCVSDTLRHTACRDSSSLETLSDTQRRQVDRFLDILLEVNKEMNLTAIRDKQEAYERHVGQHSISVRIVQFISVLSLHCVSSANMCAEIERGSNALYENKVRSTRDSLQPLTALSVAQVTHLLFCPCWMRL